MPANMQGMLNTPRDGIATLVTMQAAKTKEVEGTGSRKFSEVMAKFHTGACGDFLSLEVGGKVDGMLLFLKNLTTKTPESLGICPVVNYSMQARWSEHPTNVESLPSLALRRV